ncbi:MAG: helix-turn-helix domain-containing protein [Pseudoxanthomonas sp.]
MPTMQPLPVAAILVTPYAAASVVYGMYDLFRSAGRDWGMIQHGVAGAGVVQPVLVASQPGPQPILNGVVIEPEATLEAIGLPQIVCIPEATGYPAHDVNGQYGAEIEWLRRCSAHGSIIASTCSGAVLLAQAGLLDDQDATTHWAFAEIFATRFPRVRLHPRSALVASGEGQRLVMAGGGASCMDLALYLIARVAGIGCAIHTARVNLVDWHTVGQQPYAQLARSRQSEDALIAGCQAWIAEHYAEAAPVAGMVRHSRLPERTFKRRFQQATGLSPLDYVHTLRLEEAKHLLEAGDDSLDAIANSIGYEDSGFFGRLFKRNVGITPAEYRRRFGGLQRMLKAG